MKAKLIAATRLTQSLLKEQAWPLLGLFIISFAINASVEDAMHLATPAQESERWMLQLLLGLWDLCEGIILLLVLSWAVPLVHIFKAKDLLPQPFASPYFASLAAEYLRQLAQILMWGLLLIVPGFVRYCQLLFVPYIALFSKSYRAGEADALKLSEKLAKGHILQIFAILFCTMGLQIAFEFAPQMVEELHIFPLRVGFAALSFLISIWTYSLIFQLFESFLMEQE